MVVTIEDDHAIDRLVLVLHSQLIPRWLPQWNELVLDLAHVLSHQLVLARALQRLVANLLHTSRLVRAIDLIL